MPFYKQVFGYIIDFIFFLLYINYIINFESNTANRIFCRKNGEILTPEVENG